MTEVRERNNLVPAGAVLLGVGVVAWWIGMSTTTGGIVAGGQTFLAVGWGLLAAGVARGLATRRGRRMPVLALVGIAAVAAIAATYVLADLAAMMLR